MARRRALNSRTWRTRGTPRNSRCPYSVRWQSSIWKPRSSRPLRLAQPSLRDTTSMPAFLFDLDGTLVDSVYQHVLAWRDALEIAGLPLAVWRIHRRIGMSGGLFVSALAREIGHNLTPGEVERMQALHGEAYRKYSGQVRPLPGARELLAYLAEQGVPHAIATSGYRDSAAPALAALGVA